MAEPQEQREAPKRGAFLNVLVVLGVIGLLTKLWSIVVIMAHLNSRLLISPSRDPLIDISSSVLLALALFGIWHLRKWGAYLVLIRLAYTVIVQLFLYHSLAMPLIGNYNGTQNVLGDVLGAALWLWAFSRKWSYFQ